MQSFVLDPAENPFNVLEPGKRPRVTLTPTLALKDGKPYLAFAVQGGDTQDQNLLQFFLNVVEFGMNVAGGGRGAEHQQLPDAQLVRRPRVGAGADRAQRRRRRPWVREELTRMGYKIALEPKTSGPINAIFLDREHGTIWGGSSDYGEDYGIAW